MAINMIETISGLVSVLVLGIISLKLRVVDLTGFLAGLIVGWSVFIFGGWRWFIVVLTFHVAAGMFTKYKYKVKRKMGVAEEKGGARAWQNVLANGAVAALLSVAESYIALEVLFAGFLGAVSTSMADTLGTEIGLLSIQQPRLITDLRREVPTGTSGGVSLLGEITTVLSAGFIGLIAWTIGAQKWNITAILMISVLSGFLGSTFDSLLGAMVQASYKCSVCGKITEKSTHCKKHAIYLKGHKWIDNNTVNLLSTSFGALIGILAFRLI